MRTLEIIAKKRDGRVLDEKEIAFMVDGFTSEEITDYQMSAFLMALYIRGMSKEETYYLTKTMVESGTTIDLSGIDGIKIDKHSTGGVGDKVTLILGPLLASVGLKVAKMSGRGLGHTGGTIDKLESIPGFNVSLTSQQFVKQVNEIGFALLGQTSTICSADKKIYALRDVPATVSSIPLIASSIMSKKIAGGADIIALDVKAGSGAFMKTPEEARELALELIAIAREFGKKAFAVISNMDQPLGTAVGNALEVREAIDTLNGKGAPDVMELSMTLGAVIMKEAGLVQAEKDAMSILEKKIECGDALKTFQVFIEAQGGNPSTTENPRAVLPQAAYVEDYETVAEGFVERIDGELIGEAAKVLGAGRERKEDPIDHAAGIYMVHKVGDYINAGDTILEMHANDINKITRARQIIEKAIYLSVNKHDAGPIVYDIID
jgi:pyrimidine-nucleoside phosphorylase